MASKNAGRHWSVFDGVRFLPTTPDALVTEIDAAIATLEYAHATAMFNSSPRPPSRGRSSTSVCDARIAGEAYKLGCAQLSNGKVDEGLQSLSISLSKT